MQKLVLASSSPRRKELLSLLQIPFEVQSSDADESFDDLLSPSEVVMELAERKAKHIATDSQDSIVIGADTIVVVGKDILGKPTSAEEAFVMLKTLSGRAHDVYTGVCIIGNGKSIKFYEKTNVVFWELTDEDIHSYIHTGEPFDKAGSYGIQGYGSLLVKRIEGDYFSVVGLPVARLAKELKEFM